MIEKEKEVLADLLANKNPVLFLGAGFSLGAVQHDGVTEIPGGGELARRLIEDLLGVPPTAPEYGELKGYSLSKLCEYINTEKGSTQPLQDFITDIFKGARPAAFHKKLPKYAWKSIYTTNVDDIVETVYREAGGLLNVQNSRKYIEYGGRERGACRYYKLHGCVNNPDEGSVFSTANYIQSIQTQTDYRFNEFCIDILKEDFIFLGTAFDEINIDYYLKLYESAGQSSRGRLIFVNAQPTLALKAKARAMGALLIEWTAEKFLDFVCSLDMDREGGMYTERLLRTKNCFSMAYWREQYNGLKRYDSRLYYGEAPNMYDIIGDWDFISRIAADLADRIYGQDHSSCEIILGKRLAGKSCLGYRVLKLLEEKDVVTFTYSPQRFEERTLEDSLRRLGAGKKVAILIDEGAYFYPSIDRLIERMPEGLVLTVIVTSRYTAHYKWRYRLRVPVHETKYQPEIDRAFQKEILDKLERHASLGALGGKSREERNAFFENNNDVFSSLARITNGEDFKVRYTEAIREAINAREDVKSLFTDLLIFDLCDLPYYPEPLVPLVYGRNAKDILNHAGDFVMNLPRQGYKLRGTVYINDLRRFVGKETILRRVCAIARAIAPQVSEREKSYWKNMFESVTKVRTWCDELRLKPRELEAFRDMLMELKGVYSGISYYWIQLGLIEQRMGDYPRALTHFLQAQSIKPDSYSVLHAIARNYLKLANSKPKEALAEAQEQFTTGEERMLHLISEREFEQNKPYAIHCYVHEKLTFADRFGQRLTDEEITRIDGWCRELREIEANEGISIKCAKRFYGYLHRTGQGKRVKFTMTDLHQLELLLPSAESEALEELE